MMPIEKELVFDLAFASRGGSEHGLGASDSSSSGPVVDGIHIDVDASSFPGTSSSTPAFCFGRCFLLWTRSRWNLTPRISAKSFPQPGCGHVNSGVDAVSEVTGAMVGVSPSSPSGLCWGWCGGIGSTMEEPTPPPRRRFRPRPDEEPVKGRRRDEVASIVGEVWSPPSSKVARAIAERVLMEPLATPTTGEADDAADGVAWEEEGPLLCEMRW